MPIYEYRCDGCQAVFEVFQKASDPPPERHDCGSTAVHRQLSHTSFVLKGTGWYKTDYPSAKEKAQARDRAGEGKAGEGKPGEGKPGEGKAGEGKPGEKAGDAAKPAAPAADKPAAKAPAAKPGGPGAAH